MLLRLVEYFVKIAMKGPVRELNPGPLAPKAIIMPLDQQANPALLIDKVNSAMLRKQFWTQH